MAKRYQELQGQVIRRTTSISVAPVDTSKRSESKMSQQHNNSSSRMEKLERQMAMLERDQATISSIVSSAIKNDSDELRVSQNPDQLWSCKKCSSRLGFYDPEEDLLRIRYKDFVAYVHLGVGGVIQVVCRQCSEMNEVHYVGVAENDTDVAT